MRKYPFPYRTMGLMTGNGSGTQAGWKDTIRIFASGPVFMLFTLLVMLLTYVLDILSPLGVPVWLLYFLPLFLSFWSDREYAIPAVCFVTVLFLAAGLAFSPPGMEESIAFLMRMIFLAIFLAVSAMLWILWRKKRLSEIIRSS
jgi:hypothetical protein